MIESALRLRTAACSLVLAILASVLKAQDGPPAAAASPEAPAIAWSPNLLLGSHRIGAGIELSAAAFKPAALLARLPWPSTRAVGRERLGLTAMVGAMGWERDYGIPGKSLTGRADLKIVYGLGEGTAFGLALPGAWARGRHNLSFGFNGYLDSRGTSQVTGQLGYLYAADRDAFLADYENDTMAPWPADKYRTGAFRVAWLHDLGGHAAGLAAGFNLWAGERIFDLAAIWNGGDIAWPEEMHRGRTVTLYNAKEYAVDVVYLSFLFDGLSLSAGYDSELFKRLIHNSIHWILNDGNLPPVDRGDRIFLEFRIGAGRSLW